ncbi:MAG: PHP domain-containing protein [Propionibacteriaceae bacterium]|nr:PHP domain-containing protein [Propionibacteriaceae bacterium]
MIDLHTHSEYSDGTDQPGELVAKAAAAGLSAVALTDHDTFDGLGEAYAAGAAAGVQVVGGLELSAEYLGASVHLLGYGPNPGDPALGAELAKLRASRTRRIPATLERLAALGMPISAAAWSQSVGDSPSPGRPHVADAMILEGYVATRDEAFHDYLDTAADAYVPRYYTPLLTAIDLIRGAGGVAVIAHPWSRDSLAVLSPEVLADLAAHGLDGIEADHHDHPPEFRARLRALAADLGLLATGSSDYHGLGKQNHELGSCVTEPEVFAEIMNRVESRNYE